MSRVSVSVEAIMGEMIRRITEEELAECTFKQMCLYCGKPIRQNPRGRKKKFCSDQCRSRWHSAHPHPENWPSARTAVCPYCGKEFLASRERKKVRKYCSHACANRARAERAKEKPEDN